MATEQSPTPAARARLAAVLRATQEVVSIDDVVEALDLDRVAAAKMLARWHDQGWLRRVGRGTYVPVPLSSLGSTQVVEDPWVLVPTLFGQCYIGGVTAAHHWDLTEQLFNEIVVFTEKRLTNKSPTVQGVRFTLHHVNSSRLFGLKSIWRGSQRVNISDPARTLIDMLDTPTTGGGIDHVADCLSAYARSKDFNAETLVQYGEQFGNGAVFKRLGYLAEARLGHRELADACRARLTQGYAQLDASLRNSHLSTAWHLWVPSRWHRSFR